MTRRIKPAIVFLPQFYDHLAPVSELKINYYEKVQDPSGVTRVYS